MRLEAKLIDIIDSLKDDLVKFCCDLVKINTVNPYSGDPEPGNEEAGQEVLARKMESLGASVKYIYIPENIYERAGIIGPPGRKFEGRPNLLAKFDFGGGGRTIIINGHMDTVGVENMTIPPFDATVCNGKILGRGTSDDKGGITAAAIALEALIKLGAPLKGKVIFMSVVEEECSGTGAGTMACCLSGINGHEAVVMDSARQGIGIAGNGVATAWITVYGQSGHSALGTINAIDKAFYLKENAIDTFKIKRPKGCSINLGVIKAGSHPSILPSEAHLGVNIFYSPLEAETSFNNGKGYNGTLIREAFERQIRDAEAFDQWLREHPSKVFWEKDALPFKTNQELPFIKDLVAACHKVNHPHELYTMEAWTDAGNIQHLLKIPVVLFSPAQEGVSHGPCEYITIDSMVSCAKALAIYLYRRLTNI